MLIDIAHSDISPATVRAAAQHELQTGVALPSVIQVIREGQVEHLRGQGSVVRGLSDAAKTYFHRLALAGLPPGVTLEDMVGECRLSPEMRRMFPEMPDADLLLIGYVDGKLVFEFENEEARG